MPTVGLALAALVLSVGSAGAQRGWGNQMPAQNIRDSAGIRIIDNIRPMWTGTQTPRLSPRPELVIGDRRGSQYQLSRVAGAARLLDGRFVVADGGSLQLRFYDSTGTFIKSVGRKGQGPGEFQRLDRLARLGIDTLVTFDAQATNTFFSTTGELVATSAPPVQSTPPAFLRHVLAVLSIDSRVIASISNPEPRSKGEKWVHSTPLAIVGKESSLVADLGSLPSTLVEMDDQPRPPWFGATMAYASLDSTFFVGFGAEYSIRVYWADGQLRTIIRRSWAPTKVTREDVDQYVDEWSKRWVRSTGAKAEKEKQDLRDDPYAETIPAFAQFIADRTGRLWVRDAHLADVAYAGQYGMLPLVPSSWSVFDQFGRWLGVVTMPARFLPQEIGGDYVLGVARDDDGVETVVMYRMRAGNPAR